MGLTNTPTAFPMPIEYHIPPPKRTRKQKISKIFHFPIDISIVLLYYPLNTVVQLEILHYNIILVNGIITLKI